MSRNVKFAFEHGDKVRDIVTGMEGIITVRAEHMNGCLRYTVEPKAEGNKLTGYWVDEGQLVLVEASAVKYGGKPELVGTGPARSPAESRVVARS